MSERRALPHRSLPRVLPGWRAPPAIHRVGCSHPRPTPAPPARRARRGARDAGSAPSPRFRGPGPARCVADVPGPGPRSAHWAPERALRPEKHLLCTEPGKLSPSLLAFMAADWEVPGRPGCQGRGALIYMVQALFLLFFHTPQPSFSQLRQAGRTDVKQAPLPLPRGRWPGPAAPAWLRIGGSRGKLRANPEARAARPRSAESPGAGAARERPRGWRGRRPHAGRRRPLARPPAVSAEAFGLPGPVAFAPAAVGVWSPRRRPRVSGVLRREDGVRLRWGVGARGAAGSGVTPAERQRPANQRRAGRVPCPASETPRTVITWIPRVTTGTRRRRPPAPGFGPLCRALSPVASQNSGCQVPPPSPGFLIQSVRWEVRERAFPSFRVKSQLFVHTALPSLYPLGGPRLQVSPSLRLQGLSLQSPALLAPLDPPATLPTTFGS